MRVCYMPTFFKKEAAAAAKLLMCGLVKDFLRVLWFEIRCIINASTLGQFG